MEIRKNERFEEVKWEAMPMNIKISETIFCCYKELQIHYDEIMRCRREEKKPIE